MRVRVAIIGLDHMHAGDQLAVARDLSSAEVVAVWDDSPVRLAQFSDELEIAPERRFLDFDALLADARPEVAVVCTTTAQHRETVERLAAAGIHVLLEKPFAPSLVDAHAMIRATERAGVRLAINWPLAWYPVHRTARRLIEDGRIGAVREVHYFDGNRGPLFHTHGKREIDPETVASTKASAWWYRAADGGGSLRDYLGYGSTLTTWFRDGELPEDVSARIHVAPGDEVDEQSVVIASYADGLSTFQTRWGTFTDPWVHQPFPRCGFVIVGELGTIASFDYAEHAILQDEHHPEGNAVPVDVLSTEEASGLANLIHAIENDLELAGPLSWQTSLSGQRIVEAAAESARLGGRTVALADHA